MSTNKMLALLLVVAAASCTSAFYTPTVTLKPHATPAPTPMHHAALKWSTPLATMGTEVQAMGADPYSPRAVLGTDQAFGVFHVETGLFLWNESFVDQQAELEGPFFFGAMGETFAAPAPNSGTAQTVWGYNTTNGTQMWNVFDDASIDDLVLTSDGVDYFAGCVTNGAIVKIDGRTGAKLWTTPVGDYGFQLVMAGAHGVLGAYDNIAGLYDAKTGAAKWSINLPTQAAGVAYDPSSGLALYVGISDVNGSPLGYTTLFAIDVVKGKMPWSRNFTTVFNASVVVGPRMFYLSSTAGVTAIDAMHGGIVFKFSALALTNGNTQALVYNARAQHLYTSLTGTDLTAIDAISGRKAWEVSLPAPQVMTAQPIIKGRMIIVATSNVPSNTMPFVLGYETISTR